MQITPTDFKYTLCAIDEEIDVDDDDNNDFVCRVFSAIFFRLVFFFKFRLYILSCTLHTYNFCNAARNARPNHVCMRNPDKNKQKTENDSVLFMQSNDLVDVYFIMFLPYYLFTL